MKIVPASKVKKHRELFENIGEKLRIEKQEDWYSITGRRVKQLGAASVISSYNGSFVSAPQSIYPEFQWNTILFRFVPLNYWKDKKNQRDLFDSIGEQLGIELQEDWYKITGDDVQRLAGDGFLRGNYNNSFIAALQSIYSEYQWNPLLLRFVPQNSWQDKNNQRALFDWIGEQLGLELQEDWYSVTGDQIKRHGAKSLLGYYNESFISAPQSIYSEFQWNPVLFHSIPRNYWKDKKNQRDMLNFISGQLGIERQGDWYSFTGQEVVKEFGTSGLLDHYNNSLISAPRSIYPEFEWHPFPFQSIPHRYWQPQSRRRRCLEWIGEQLGITQMKEWLLVPKHAVIHLGAGSLLSRYGHSWRKTLEGVFPEFDWESAITLSEGERQTHKTLKTVLDTDIFVNYKFHGPHGLVELDFYIPSLSLALEYQGQMHYTQFVQDSLQTKQNRDQFKRELCASRGITLVAIPYWWDHSPHALISAIWKHRPEIRFNLQNLEPPPDKASTAGEQL